MISNAMRILIDADGCPVTKAAVKIADEYGIKTIIFCDTSHIFNLPNTEVITVGKGADSADFALVNQIEANDIVITQDYGLAAMALARKGRPITQNGVIINHSNIDLMLAARHAAKNAQMAGGRIKGPSKRTRRQDEKFIESLKELIGKKS